MRWLAAFTAAAAFACEEAPPPGERLFACETQAYEKWRDPLPADVLFVIDETEPTMAASQTIAQHLEWFGMAMSGMEGGTDLHVGVVSADVDRSGGRLEAPFLVDRRMPDGTHVTNYAGELADALVAVGTLPGGSTTSQPLAAMHLALGGSVPENAGFVRPGVWLVVVVISAVDDASPDPLYVYVEGLTGTVPRPHGIIASAVAPADSVRLRALTDFVERSAFVEFEDLYDWWTALELLFSLAKRTLDHPCPFEGADPTDVEPDATGVQLECIVMETHPDGTEILLRTCAMEQEGVPSDGAERPCWFTFPDDVCGEFLPPGHNFSVARADWPPYGTLVDIRCNGVCE